METTTGARDMVGLDKSRTSFSSQVFHSLGTQRKITLCLSPTFGVVQLGKVAHESQPGKYQLSLWGFTLGMGLLHGVCDGFGASKFFRALAELACTVEKVSLLGMFQCALGKQFESLETFWSKCT
ncbi:hypothetical protein JHK85_019409 [Glycine max]|nr:hypothetical protein JHK85_019409 [Glycine max]KAG5038146.1 hypothetical protein JHK86_018986 [Glycine max]